LILTILLLITNIAVADDVFLRYNIHAVAPYPDVSSLSLGYVNHRKVFSFKYEAGIVLDRRIPNKAGLFSAAVGIQPEWGPIGFYFYQGIGLLTSTDKYLSTNYQFIEQAGIYFRGKNGSHLGPGCWHMSNAGIKLPNLGKDFCGLMVGIKL
jgi:hypothetical protein